MTSNSDVAVESAHGMEEMLDGEIAVITTGPRDDRDDEVTKDR